MIVKHIQSERSGIQSQVLGRHGIGYVLRGKKYVYYGDVRYEIAQGDIFYLGSGTHYIEDVPDGTKSFEQIVFYYTPQELSNIMNHLSMHYKLKISNDLGQPDHYDKSHMAYPAWDIMRHFFLTVDHYIKENVFGRDDTAESIKMTELIYLILTNGDCYIKGKILDNVDEIRENFEYIVRKHVFNDISMQDLAAECNRSLTSFKKEFRKRFYESPHKWFVRQRLMHARLLLISTAKSISEISAECSFTNTSHFIKLFKKEYGITPAVYRSQHRRK